MQGDFIFHVLTNSEASDGEGVGGKESSDGLQSSIRVDGIVEEFSGECRGFLIGEKGEDGVV